MEKDQLEYSEKDFFSGFEIYSEIVFRPTRNNKAKPTPDQKWSDFSFMLDPLFIRARVKMFVFGNCPNF